MRLAVDGDGEGHGEHPAVWDLQAIWQRRVAGRLHDGVADTLVSAERRALRLRVPPERLPGSQCWCGTKKIRIRARRAADTTARRWSRSCTSSATGCTLGQTLPPSLRKSF
jgi:hypothetical protein